MRRLFSRLGLRTWAALAAVAVCGAVALWLNRDGLVRWHVLRGLDAATEQNRDDWARRAADLGDGAIPALLDRFADDEPRLCANAGAALILLARSWGADDSRADDLAGQLAERFDHMSTPGKEASLELQLALLAEFDAEVPEGAGQLFARAAKTAEPGVRVRALALGEVLAGRAPGRWSEVYPELVRAALESDDAPSKVRALRLAMHEALRQEPGLLKRAAALLRDPEAEVRRAALLAVGMAADAVAEDDLLPLLHDADADVRRLCGDALRGRGLGSAHLKLAWLVSHREPAMRLEVLHHLDDAEDLDPGVWLLRLSQDPDWAVRVAAIRAAAENPAIDFRSRLQEMRQGDPSETVRGLAAYWLERRR